MRIGEFHSIPLPSTPYPATSRYHQITTTNILNLLLPHLRTTFTTVYDAATFYYVDTFRSITIQSQIHTYDASFLEAIATRPHDYDDTSLTVFTNTGLTFIFTYDATIRSAATISINSPTYIHEPLAKIEGASTHYYHHSRQPSDEHSESQDGHACAELRHEAPTDVAGLTDAAGLVVELYAYSPYGTQTPSMPRAPR